MKAYHLKGLRICPGKEQTLDLSTRNNIVHSQTRDIIPLNILFHEILNFWFVSSKDPAPYLGPKDVLNMP